MTPLPKRYVVCVCVCVWQSSLFVSFLCGVVAQKKKKKRGVIDHLSIYQSVYCFLFEHNNILCVFFLKYLYIQQGLFFIGYANTPVKFERMLASMVGGNGDSDDDSGGCGGGGGASAACGPADRLFTFSRCVRSNWYYVPSAPSLQQLVPPTALAHPARRGRTCKM